ncbi:MAG: coproporphyrinogen dehydrogenase HemZ [Clostridiaceae bacterium]|nr:coproporphyrinogen dehydrogenase HemZ [Clostridiaceae bacterium]
MPGLRLIGHQNTYPVSDILRLFFGVPRLAEPDLFIAGSADPLIISRLEAAGADLVKITTGMPDREISSIVAAVQARREIKRQLYQLLADWTGCYFPWGSLTGIRPTQVAAESLRRTGSEQAAGDELTGHWFVSPEKASLAIETARAEQALLDRIPPDQVMVYLGIPFCPSRCAYCSFIAQDALHHAQLLEPYVEAVIRETRTFFHRFNRPVSALYIGGGTPTSLSDPLFHRLLTGVLPELPLSPDAELTIEAGRPDTISEAKLDMIRQAGATRLCINPQTFHDATLERIGRRHTVEETLTAYRLARSMGFNRINMDLIAGLPGESPDDFADSLNQALALAPDSITLHTLAMKRSSRLYQEQMQNQRRQDAETLPESSATALPPVHRPDPGLAAMLEQGRRTLADAGLLPYYLYRQKDVAGGLENTGFARPGEGCRYNVGMMSDQRTVIGLGSGAMTKWVEGSRVERAPNPRDIGNYISRVDELAECKIELFQKSERPQVNPNAAG